MRLNNRGQALIEFVLILPIFLMILFIIVDFGVIFNAKSSLENQSADIVSLIQNGADLNTIKTTYPDLEVNITEDEVYTTITITNYVDLITPGLNYVLDDPYKLTVERIIPHDETEQ